MQTGTPGGSSPTPTPETGAAPILDRQIGAEPIYFPAMESRLVTLTITVPAGTAETIATPPIDRPAIIESVVLYTSRGTGVLVSLVHGTEHETGTTLLPSGESIIDRITTPDQGTVNPSIPLIRVETAFTPMQHYLDDRMDRIALQVVNSGITPVTVQAAISMKSPSVMKLPAGCCPPEMRF